MCKGKADWYTAKCELLCDEEHGRFFDINKMRRYKKWYPYDTIQKANGDSVAISFEFYTDCCLDFSGGIDLREDTLDLQYGLASDTLAPCDCYCDYRMIYKIKKGNLNWTTVKITNTNGYKPSP